MVTLEDKSIELLDGGGGGAGLPAEGQARRHQDFNAADLAADAFFARDWPETLPVKYNACVKAIYDGCNDRFSRKMVPEAILDDDLVNRCRREGVERSNQTVPCTLDSVSKEEQLELPGRMPGPEPVCFDVTGEYDRGANKRGTLESLLRTIMRPGVVASCIGSMISWPVLYTEPERS
ncbi:26S protease regulatory subunit 6a [Culex quinquefasciatus]|uniref:26S protease regulatory subunit 6a n=1 Tax=Culex quinquefasciatus TaxID=7176 RepID=B0XF96_CULQU|nr:26S protease regulatory subunit 6a [Culex quinquefasciatus]|eukprot:XP_001868318.1 26S protease regulatory subunit 6a [Culex quinquefasciatus]